MVISTGVVVISLAHEEERAREETFTDSPSSILMASARTAFAQRRLGDLRTCELVAVRHQ